MKGIIPNATPWSTEGAEANWRTTIEVLDEDYFTVYLSAGSGVLDGATVPVPGERAAVIEHPDGVSSSWRTNLRIKQRWRRGGLRLTLDYSSPVGSTNNFRVILGVRAFSAGSVVSGLTDIATTTFSIPGPAVANTVLTTTQIYPAPVIPVNMERLSVRLGRLGADGNDTNVNVLRVYGLLVQVLPGRA